VKQLNGKNKIREHKPKEEEANMEGAHMGGKERGEGT